MASLIPESVMHLQVTAVVNPLELYRVGHKDIILYEAKEMATQVLHKLLDNCIEIKADKYGSILKLDVYVFSPDDLEQLITQARKEGAQDAMKWSLTTF